MRQGLLSEDEASKHRYRNVITNAIGATPTFRLDVLHFTVEAGDVILVVSDGISMLLSEPLLAQVIASNEPETAAKRLVREANERGSPDNVTAVVLKVEDVSQRAKRYDLPEQQLEVSTVAIGDTLSGIKKVEDDFPANGPIARFKRHPLYPHRLWLFGSVSLLALAIIFLLLRY